MLFLRISYKTTRRSYFSYKRNSLTWISSPRSKYHHTTYNHIIYKRERRVVRVLRPSVPCMRLVPAACNTTISDILLNSSSDSAYLQTGTPSQRTPQLHESSRNLVTHSGMTLVVNTGSAYAVAGTVMLGGASSGRGSGSSCGRCTTSTGSSTLGTEQSGLETWSCSGTGSPRSAGSNGGVMGTATERHVDVYVVWEV